jgi:hypothetical protein
MGFYNNNCFGCFIYGDPALSTTSWLLSFRLSGCMPVRTVIVPVNISPLLSQDHNINTHTYRKINVVKYSTVPVVRFEVLRRAVLRIRIQIRLPDPSIIKQK